MRHKCYHAEISTEWCNLEHSDCMARMASGVCRVKFTPESTAREKARIAYCRTIGKEPDITSWGDLNCTNSSWRSYCGACEEFIKNYDNE